MKTFIFSIIGASIRYLSINIFNLFYKKRFVSFLHIWQMDKSKDRYNKEGFNNAFLGMMAIIIIIVIVSISEFIRYNLLK